MDEVKKQQDIAKHADKIHYSARYHDDVWEYRHVTLPKELVKYVSLDRLMDEDEWRGLGVQQSLGWEHYLIHRPEPHVLLFRREKDYQIKYPHGKPPPSTTTSSSSSSSLLSANHPGVSSKSLNPTNTVTNSSANENHERTSSSSTSSGIGGLVGVRR